MVLTCLVICSHEEQIYTVNWQSLLFRAKKYDTGRMGGWMDGWMEGWMDGKAGLRIAYSNQKHGNKKHGNPHLKK